MSYPIAIILLAWFAIFSLVLVAISLGAGLKHAAISFALSIFAVVLSSIAIALVMSLRYTFGDVLPVVGLAMASGLVFEDLVRVIASTLYKSANGKKIYRWSLSLAAWYTLFEIFRIYYNVIGSAATLASNGTIAYMRETEITYISLLLIIIGCVIRYASHHALNLCYFYAWRSGIKSRVAMLFILHVLLDFSFILIGPSHGGSLAVPTLVLAASACLFGFLATKYARIADAQT